MAFALLFVSVIFLIFAFKLFHRPRFHLPPGPCPWPIIGNIFQMNPVMFRGFAEWSQLYGPIISVWVGSSLNVVVSDPELAKEVLKDNDQHLAYRNRNKVLSILTKNGMDLTWADYGSHYVKVRKVCTIEMFSHKSLEVFRPIREDEVSIMVESIFKDCVITDNKRTSLVVRNYLQEVAFNYITGSVFGKRFRTAEGEMDEHGAELKAIMADQARVGASLLQIVEYIPGLQWMSWLQEAGFQKHLSRLQKNFRAIIEERQLSHKEYGGARQDFVAILLSLQKENNLSEDTIIGLIWNMMTAGTDTSAIAVEWALTQLVKNLTVQKKAQEELGHVIGSGRVMTESDLPNLSYLQAIAKEALRLHPTTPLMLPHKANANVKIGGYDVPQGTSVLVNTWAIARDPKVWKDPLEFRPERFLEEDVDIKGHDFRLLPFGSGRRVCPGAQLGLTLVCSMLGHLLHHFNWTLPQGVKPEDIDMLEIPGVVAYMRTPLEAVPSPRLPSHLYKRESVL